MTAQELEQEIERTREHLGETIDELASQADLKARARARAAEMRARAQDRVADMSGRVRQSQLVRGEVLQRRWPVAVAAGVLIAGTVIIRRRRKRA
jgi:transcription elongation GreA/GreB family factor